MVTERLLAGLGPKGAVTGGSLVSSGPSQTPPFQIPVLTPPPLPPGPGCPVSLCVPQPWTVVWALWHGSGPTASCTCLTTSTINKLLKETLFSPSSRPSTLPCTQTVSTRPWVGQRRPGRELQAERAPCLAFRPDSPGEGQGQGQGRECWAEWNPPTPPRTTEREALTADPVSSLVLTGRNQGTFQFKDSKK